MIVGRLRDGRRERRSEMQGVASRTAHQILRDRLAELLQSRQAREVVARARIPETQLSRWRTGAQEPNPQLSTLVRLAKALGVSVAYLISNEAELASARVDLELSAAERELEAAERSLRERREALRRQTPGS